jgi:hypothetical protein
MNTQIFIIIFGPLVTNIIIIMTTSITDLPLHVFVEHIAPVCTLRDLKHFRTGCRDFATYTDSLAADLEARKSALDSALQRVRLYVHFDWKKSRSGTRPSASICIAVAQTWDSNNNNDNKGEQTKRGITLISLTDCDNKARIRKVSSKRLDQSSRFMALCSMTSAWVIGAVVRAAMDSLVAQKVKPNRGVMECLGAVVSATHQHGTSNYMEEQSWPSCSKERDYNNNNIAFDIYCCKQSGCVCKKNREDRNPNTTQCCAGIIAIGSRESSESSVVNDKNNNNFNKNINNNNPKTESLNATRLKTVVWASTSLARIVTREHFYVLILGENMGDLARAACPPSLLASMNDWAADQVYKNSTTT